MSIPWVKKYSPDRVSEIQGQDKAISKLKDFVFNFRQKKKKAVILYGPPGNGKTSSVNALAKELNLELIEINASDFRNADQINSVVGFSSQQQSLFFKSKLILVDEIDGLSGNKDRGGISALTKLLQKTSFPIVITANSPFDPKLSTLRKRCDMIEFHTLNYLSVYSILKKICGNESIKYHDDDLKSLARRSGGDLRGAITDLQTLTTDKRLDKESLDELSGRKQTESMLKALVKLFKTTDPKIALTVFENVDEDVNKIFLWIDENLPKEYSDPEDLASAYNKLSRADVFRGRIRRWQHWRFSSYIYELLSAGIAVSKKEKYKNFIAYKPSSRILKLWIAKQQNLKKKAIAAKIAEHTHTSTKEILKNIDYYRIIFKKNRDMADCIAKELELDNEEVEWLRR